MTASLLFDILGTGLITGGIYALVALGLNLQYGLMRVLNVAHGEFLMLGAYVTYSLHTGWGANPLLTVLVTGPAGFVAGLVLHRLLFARVLAQAGARAAIESRSLLLSFGLLFVLQNTALLVWSADLQGYSYLAIPLRVLGAVFPANRVLAAVVALALSVAFYVYLRRSLVGQAIRALMEEPEGAQLVGVNLIRLHGICFGLGVAMAAVTGSLISMLFELTPFVGLPYTVTALVVVILADIALAVSWAFFSGPTRYLSLATGAFFGAGAYATAVVGGRLAWPLPVLAGAAVGGAIALRLRGPYFAVFTFGLAELAKHTLIWYETRVTGTVGRLLLSPPGPWTLYYTVLALAGLAVGTALLLRRSRWGYALVGIGEDDERALTLGIDTTRVKVGTFALSAAFMGAVGAAMVPRWTYLDPQVFNPLVSFQTVIMALVGGATTVVGPALGAAFLGLVSELFLLRFRYVYMLALGLTLIAVVVAFPSGLAGIGRRAPRERQG